MRFCYSHTVEYTKKTPAGVDKLCPIMANNSVTLIPSNISFIRCEGTTDRRGQPMSLINNHYFHVSMIVEIVDIDEDVSRRHYYRMRDILFISWMMTTGVTSVIDLKVNNSNKRRRVRRN
jgi:hypothetical protein